jgi:hypothetical protein
MRRVAIGSMIGVLMLAGCGGGSDRSQAAMSANDDAASTAQAATSAAAVPEFTLTDAFLAKYQAYQEEAAKDPCTLSPLMVLSGEENENLTLDQAVARFGAQPGVAAALQRAGLSAHDLIVGMTTLMGAAAQDIAAQHPDMVAKGEIKLGVKVSPANLAFYRQHKDTLHAHQMALAKEQLAQNGGKLPSCMTGQR